MCYKTIYFKTICFFSKYILDYKTSISYTYHTNGGNFMERRIVLLLLTKMWADWEAAYAVSNINLDSHFQVKTIAIDKEPKMSMGGINATIDHTFKDYKNLDDVAMLIIPGGLGWESQFNKDIPTFIEKVINAKIPVAAICGATLFLGRHGFLNNVKHTGDELELFQQYDEYLGDNLHMENQCVVDQGIITANETAAIEFAYQIFKTLKIREDADLDFWYDYFKNGMIR